MTNNSTILIYRYGNIYKAKVSALSSLYSFHTEIAELSASTSAYLDNVWDAVGNLTDFFDNEHYTKAEQKERFASKEEATNLTANEKYVLTSKVNGIVSGLVSQSQLSTWQATQTDKCFNLLSTAYRVVATGYLDKDDDSPGGHAIRHDNWMDYTKAPSTAAQLFAGTNEEGVHPVKEDTDFGI